MKKFEYKTFEFSNWHLFDSLLESEGAAGWELICFKDCLTKIYAYFKREIHE